MDQSRRSNRTSVRTISVDDEVAGQRIDNFLATCLKGVPRTRIYRLLRRGEVRVNRSRVRQHYRLASGDIVRIPPVREDVPPSPKTPDELRQRTISRAILYEDDGLIVLDKPAGWAVHGGSGLRFGVIECLRAARPLARRLELVHRLDRDTSGCLLVAKRRSVLGVLHEALRQGRMRKRYLALTRGNFGGRRLRCDKPLLREQRRTGDRIVRIDGRGKRSSTNFAPVDVGEVASLIAAHPVTGRTHQIRVHAASLSAPIAGDEKYGDRSFNRLMQAHGLRRLFLHAASIAVPVDGEWMTFDAPLPADLASVLAEIGLRVP